MNNQHMLCNTCRNQAGAHNMCESCIHNRDLIDRLEEDIRKLKSKFMGFTSALEGLARLADEEK